MNRKLLPRLNSYRPLCLTKFGREIAEKNQLQPYIDGSIRREPDFESSYPSVTGLCRLNKFAPKLKKGTQVAYMTVQGAYEGHNEPHWRLVAILEVIEQYLETDAHERAFQWYADQNLAAPYNCIALGNKGVDFELSSQQMDFSRRKRTSAEQWEADYQIRAKIAPAFNITKVKRLELTNPPILLAEDLKRIFGLIPGTQTPPYITIEQLKMLDEEFNKVTQSPCHHSCHLSKDSASSMFPHPGSKILGVSPATPIP